MTQTRLKQLREDAVLTVHELAKTSGVSDDTISKIENGQRVARPSTLRKLASALGVSPQELRRPAKVEEPALSGKAEAPREAGPAARPKAEAVPLKQWLEERCGHARLAMESDEIADFLRGANSIEVHKERRRLLKEEVLIVDEERKKYPALAEIEIGGVPYMEIRMRYLFATLVSVEVGAITAKEAELELAAA